MVVVRFPWPLRYCFNRENRTRVFACLRVCAPFRCKICFAFLPCNSNAGTLCCTTSDGSSGKQGWNLSFRFQRMVNHDQSFI